MRLETLELSFGEDVIEFTLERRDRKTLSISVRPDLGVEIAAPTDALLEQILERVRKRAPWIRRQIRYFAQFQPRTPERHYIPGETHLYLGRQYKLTVAASIQQDVKLYRGRLMVHSHRPKDRNVTHELVQAWFCERAQVKFRERLEVCRQRFPRPEDHSPVGIVVRELQQRWGSMTPSGKLLLNRSLIRASVDAIDYVITHELCHIRHHHHGPEFYKLLDWVMPDWEWRKSKLERQLA